MASPINATSDIAKDRRKWLNWNSKEVMSIIVDGAVRGTGWASVQAKIEQAFPGHLTIPSGVHLQDVAFNSVSALLQHMNELVPAVPVPTVELLPMDPPPARCPNEYNVIRALLWEMCRPGLGEVDWSWVQAKLAVLYPRCEVPREAILHKIAVNGRQPMKPLHPPKAPKEPKPRRAPLPAPAAAPAVVQENRPLPAWRQDDAFRLNMLRTVKVHGAHLCKTAWHSVCRSLQSLHSEYPDITATEVHACYDECARGFKERHPSGLLLDSDVTSEDQLMASLLGSMVKVKDSVQPESPKQPEPLRQPELPKAPVLPPCAELLAKIAHLTLTAPAVCVDLIEDVKAITFELTPSPAVLLPEPVHELVTVPSQRKRGRPSGPLAKRTARTARKKARTARTVENRPKAGPHSFISPSFGIEDDDDLLPAAAAPRKPSSRHHNNRTKASATSVRMVFFEAMDDNGDDYLVGVSGCC